MSAFLVVRAVVADPADRADFDHWYRSEHLPDAMKAFRARSAWRGWSRTDPSVHYAYYEFESPDAADAMTSGEEILELVAEFDRCWGTKVVRSREVVEIVDRK